MIPITGTEYLIGLSDWVDKELEDVDRQIKDKNCENSYYEATLKGKRDILFLMKEKVDNYFILRG